MHECLLKLKLLAMSFKEADQGAPVVVFVSVDGERDTPAVLKQYLAGYPDNFIGLTGDPKTVRKIAAGFKAVFFKGLPYDSAGNYQVEHTSMVYLVDPEGSIRAVGCRRTRRFVLAQSESGGPGRRRAGPCTS